MTIAAAPAQFDIGRVIGRTFKAIGGNFTSFLILTLLVQAAPNLLLSVLQIGARGGELTPTAGAELTTQSLLLNLVALVVTVITTFLVQAALIRGTFADLSGKRATLGELFSTSMQFILPLFSLAIVMAIALVLGFILLIVPGVILGVMWLVAAPVVVVEQRKGAFAALSRSAELTKGSRWAIFGLLVIFAICAWVVELVLMGVFVAVFSQGGGMTPTVIAMTLVLTAVLSALFSMVGSAGVASVYYELRTVKEGAGATDLAAVFD